MLIIVLRKRQIQFIWISGNAEISLNDEIDVVARDSFELERNKQICLKRNVMAYRQAIWNHCKSKLSDVKPNTESDQERLNIVDKKKSCIE